MKYFNTLLFTLFLTISLHGQDTTVVQTFTWESETRADYFTFPDDPDKTYRKIWMVYNMRCHDAAVGNFSVGCREWDYSCNTFLTDTTRVDSTRQTHPTHVVSNFDGETFSYSDLPTYSYFQYDQHQTTLTPVDVTETIIGNGTADLTTGEPNTVSKFQFLLTAAELLSSGVEAGPIHALKLELAEPTSVIDYLKIKLKGTNQNELDPNNPELNGFTEVYFQNTAVDQSGWKDFNFYAPFDWDGSQNLLIEMSYTAGPGTDPVILKGFDTGFTTTLIANQEDYSLQFAGSGTVEVPVDNFDGPQQEITISCWQYGDPDVMPANSYLFEGLDADGNRTVNVHLPWSNGQVYWDCGNEGSDYDRINQPASTQDYEGQWNHWAFTKNADTGVMKIYLNGQEWHSGTGKTKPIDIASFNIGSSANQNGKYWGNIDEFRVWNTALDQATIQEYMLKPVDDNHPDLTDLVVYYPMNEGTGFTLTDESANPTTASISLPNWQRVRGEDLYKNFIAVPLRPNFTLIQGEVTIADEIISVLDSVINPLHQVTAYGVSGTDLEEVSTTFLYPAGDMPVYNEIGEVIYTIPATASGTIDIGTLTYYSKAPAKYELLSLVTPYGNGLDLGQDGRTFTFDVTDFAPVLKGGKYLSIEMGGQWQEELDIKFLFIEGTPSREVIDIQPIWPFRRGWFAQIQEDQFFEPRDITLNPDGSHFEIRSAITGHGQNGEFVPRNHYININGGAQEFAYDVWKYCGKNPIYPQGGTWVFDRAGWCPGMATDVHVFPLENADPGSTISIDYGVNGAFMDAANYLVNNQMVTYGAYNFANDASLEYIMRPNNTQVEFDRINPACTTPLVWVKNTGSNTLTEIEIEYQVVGGTAVTHLWTGSLEPGKSEEILLPVETMDFWSTDETEQIFEATILSVNGGADEESANNYLQSPFTPAKVFDYEEPMEFQISTNLVPQDNSYTITDASGNVVMSRDNMQASTTYKDALELPAGCYTLNFEDTGNDGLSFWFFPQNGGGSIRFNRIFNDVIPLVIHGFSSGYGGSSSDFGGGLQFDFVMPLLTGSEEVENYRLLSVFPNPAHDQVNVELHGFQTGELQLQLTNLTGQVLLTKRFTPVSSEYHLESVDLTAFPNGMYFIKVFNDKKEWTQEVIKQRR